MVQERIIVISSTAQDHIHYLASGKRQIKLGGPARWISRTLHDLHVPFKLITSRKSAAVKMTVVAGDERGSIVSVKKIPLKSVRKADIFIISTIADEFDLSNISRMEGVIALDVQGYVRAAKKRDFENLQFQSAWHPV